MIKNQPEPGAKRNQAEAKKVLADHFPFKCCAVCGLQIKTCLTVAHLDQDPTNNAPDNLARLCQTHHWMYDAGLYPMDAIRIMQEHWQKTQGKPDHSARLKGAASRAAATKRRKAAAAKAVKTKAAKAAK